MDCSKKAGEATAIGKVNGMTVYEVHFATTANGNPKAIIDGVMAFAAREAQWDGQKSPALDKPWYVMIDKPEEVHTFSYSDKPFYLLRPASAEEITQAQANPVPEPEELPASTPAPKEPTPAAESPSPYKKPLLTKPTQLVTLSKSYSGKAFVKAGRGHSYLLKKNKKLTDLPQPDEIWIVDVDPKEHKFRGSFDTYQYATPIRKATTEDFREHHQDRGIRMILGWTDFADNPWEESITLMAELAARCPDVLEHPRTLGEWNQLAHQIADEYGIVPQKRKLTIFFREEQSEQHEALKKTHIEKNSHRKIVFQTAGDSEADFQKEWYIMTLTFEKESPE